MNHRTFDRRLRRLEQTTKLRLSAFNVEFYELSLDGELIPWPDPSHVQDDNRPAEWTLRVLFVDSDGNGGLGPCYRAYMKRQEMAAIGGPDSCR